MANLITLSRFLLLILVVVILYQPAAAWKFVDVPLLVLTFATDGLDGYAARKRGEESLFGAMFDVAMDRIVENVLWLVLAALALVPVWVPIVFLVRGSLVDAVRSHGGRQGDSPFAMMNSALGRFLVAGRFMRGFYAVLKAVTFSWIIFLQPMPSVIPSFWGHWAGILNPVTASLVYLTVTLCLLRGIPVLLEFALSERAARVG
jgi:CDP-diacylglycerol--glycerol-3-phosphate 3-phosphatidyltransferase